MKLLKVVYTTEAAAEFLYSVAKELLKEQGFTSQFRAHLDLCRIRSEKQFIANEATNIFEQVMNAENAHLFLETEIVEAAERLFDEIETGVCPNLDFGDGVTYYFSSCRILDFAGTIELTVHCQNNIA